MNRKKNLFEFGNLKDTIFLIHYSFYDICPSDHCLIYHRYLGITKDFSHRKWTLKRVMLNLLIVWVISFLVYVPSASSLRLRKKHSDCYEYWKKPDQYFHAAFLLLVEYVIPLCVIGFCNYKIIRVIKDRSKNMPQMQSEEFEKRDKEQRKTVRYRPDFFSINLKF